jgi:hypothetical protein
MVARVPHGPKQRLIADEVDPGLGRNHEVDQLLRDRRSGYHPEPVSGW